MVSKPLSLATTSILGQPPSPDHNPKVIVGLSGGVDSSVTALLLQQQGYAVEGLFMKNWEEDDTQTYCAAAEDVEDARSVCETLGIPLNTVNLSADYWDQVFEPFLADLEAGRTPNPDILCNREIKFRAFLDHALDLGATVIATGHYARIRKENGRYRLLKGLDGGKDQSYFLYTLGQQQLAHALFPLGNIKKSQVRKLASESGLVTHDKKDSTGICFIGERPFQSFLKRYLPAQGGEIRTLDGRTVGRHEGVNYYTLGQRKGLGIGGVRHTNGEPWYVVRKELHNNVLIVAQGQDHPQLYSSALEAAALNWVSGQAPEIPYACHAKVRYRQPDQACTITHIDNDRCTVVFEHPQRAVAPGQSVVFYQGEICLGGGVIDAVTACV